MYIIPPTDDAWVGETEDTVGERAASYVKAEGDVIVSLPIVIVTSTAPADWTKNNFEIEIMAHDIS